MATLAERRIGAIIGSSVADAAAQPLHWNYNLEKLQSLIGDKEEIEFYTPSANPFYCIETGKQSCYGDQAFVLLKSLVENKGLNKDEVIKSTYKFFGPESEYNIEREGYLGDQKARASYPIHGPWRHSSIKTFLSNVENGLSDPGAEDDEQIDCVAKIAPVVAMYAGQEEMLDKVEEAIRITQETDSAVAIGLAGARVLEAFILNGDASVEKVLEETMAELRKSTRKNPQDLDLAVATQIKEVLTVKDQPHSETVPGLPQSFQASLHALITAKDLVSGVRATMRQGGCTSSRVSFLGACFGARVGLSGLPETWKEKTLRFPELLSLSKEISTLSEVGQ